MQKFEFLWQPFLGELAMSRKKRERKEEREKNAICSGHVRLCQQPRAAHALRLDQYENWELGQDWRKNILVLGSLATFLFAMWEMLITNVVHFCVLFW